MRKFDTKEVNDYEKTQCSARLRFRRIFRLYGCQHPQGCRSPRPAITVNARSESTVEDYVDEIDCLMIGPHLASTLPDMEEICEGYDVKVGVIEQAAYARLNGEAALDQILGLFGEA